MKIHHPLKKVRTHKTNLKQNKKILKKIIKKLKIQKIQKLEKQVILKMNNLQITLKTFIIQTCFLLFLLNRKNRLRMKIKY